MSEENKAIVRRFVEEVLNEGNLAVADEVVASNYIGYRGGREIQGPEGIKQLTAANHSAFPDHRSTIEEMIAEGDKVVTRWTARGTHQGEFMNIPPTGKQVTITGMTIYQVSGGKIVGDHMIADALGLMQQLGVVPAPGR